MQIIKKIDNIVTMESLNDSLTNLPCHGFSTQMKHSASGELTIKGIDSENFVTSLSPTLLALNIHLFNEKKLEEQDYLKIAKILAEINNLPSIILSSSQVSRITLNALREVALEFQTSLSSRIIIATSDELSNRNIKRGDMIYSGNSKSKTAYEQDRLSEYVKSGIPVILDWKDNYSQRISKMIEKTDNSDKLLVLSVKPKTTRRILNNTIN